MENLIIKPKKLPKLTKKQNGFVDDYVLTGNGTQSALNNYDIEGKNPEKIASALAVENLGKPSVALAIEIKQETLKSALIKKGITPEKIADKINVLLDATTGENEKPDVNAIDKGLKHTKDIYGIENPDEKPKSQTTYNFIFNSETQEKINAINETIKAKLIQGNV